MATWALFCVAIAGVQLVPDTAAYARGHVLQAPLTSLVGLIAGRTGIELLTVCSCIVGAYIVTSARTSTIGRWLGCASLAAWGVLPGADAAGAVPAAWSTAPECRRRAALVALAALLHPVAALVAVASHLGVTRRARRLYALAAGTGCLVVVGQLDSYSTTDRYLLPAVLIAVVTR